MPRRISSASAARPTNSRQRRSADRMLQMAQETFGRSETASTLDQLTGENGWIEAIEVAEKTRTSEHMPARTINAFLSDLANGTSNSSIEAVTKAVKLCNGVCAAIDASDKMSEAEAAIVKSALTGKGSTRAFRQQFAAKLAKLAK